PAISPPALHDALPIFKLEPEVIEQIKALPGDYHFETYVSLSCQNCPDVVQALNVMSVINPRIRSVTIDGALFQDEVASREIMAVDRKSTRLNSSHVKI